MSTVYYAAYDSTDTPVAVFRFLINEEAQTLDLERLTDQGMWAADPEAIMEIREPDVRRLAPEEISSVLLELGARRDAEAEAESPEGPGVGTEEETLAT